MILVLATVEAAKTAARSAAGPTTAPWVPAFQFPNHWPNQFDLISC